MEGKIDQAGSKSAIVAGATGLVGGHLLNQLLENPEYSMIISVARRSLGIDHPKLQEIIIDLEDLENEKTRLKADDVFCCLGTTMKKAGSKEKFQKVDYQYPVKLAEVTRLAGARHFILVSAMGADKGSIFFYNRIKGQTEEAISEIGFDHYTIVRPAMILGDRNEKRILEDIGKWVITKLDFLFFGHFRKYKGVQASDIASKMIEAALSDSNESKKVKIIESKEIS